MINRKSQAALEFIMTYGWAILVVLVAVGALAYFGVLSPDRFLPSKCVLQSGLACLEHRVDGDGGLGGGYAIQVRVQNSLGQDLDTVVGHAAGCTNTATGTIANGGEITWTFDCGTTPLAGAKFSGGFNVTYEIVGSNIAHTNVGEITARVE